MFRKVSGVIGAVAAAIVAAALARCGASNPFSSKPGARAWAVLVREKMSPPSRPGQARSGAARHRAARCRSESSWVAR